ncbi:MAG: hypothetical protein GOV00_01460 [Candidatus Altiarchaeota archaeon]|nr:hypothetical protein [Candidatus Altiarchaeota archaeon]
MNRERLAGIVFSAIMGIVAVFFTVSEVLNRTIWLIMMPILALPIVAWKSEKLAGVISFIYAGISTYLFMKGFFMISKSLQGTLQFIFLLPMPAVLIGLLLFYSASKQGGNDDKKWKAIAEKSSVEPQNQPKNAVQAPEMDPRIQERQ